MLLYFQDVEEINQQALKIQLRLTFRFYWDDQRLTKLNSALGNYWQDIKVQTARDNIFIPDLYLYQLVKQTSNIVFGRTNEAFYIGTDSKMRQEQLFHFLKNKGLLECVALCSEQIFSHSNFQILAIISLNKDANGKFSKNDGKLFLLH